MTVRELVALGRSPYTGFWGTLHNEDWQVVDEAINAVRISGLRDRMVHTLSDGERQKVMIAKALAQQTPVIFLDEPTAFLDFPSKVEMMQLLRQLAKTAQKTIFLSTHDFELALQVAYKLWLMEKEMLYVGTPRELAQSGALARYVERPGISFDAQTLTVRVNSL
jgi:iron complex transport system ATP-binding protein